ncbi:MAG: YkgJ family cysteine cluster protein [Clostridiales bacterium]|nr:YkgJ family cysteine cluster protein [Clostridiales bacterium]
MKTYTSLESISDGKIYDINDLVNVDTENCNRCSACCHNIGEMVELTPFDIHEMVKSLNTNFDQLFDDKIELVTNNKLALPYLKMHGTSEKCSFLNHNNRCIIHSARPNICRLFPLGRLYEDDGFRYVLIVDACFKEDLKPITVKEWINIDNYSENKIFIFEWYKLLKALTFRLKFVYDEKELQAINEYLINTFYRMPLKKDQDFYTAFKERLPEAKNRLNIL